jgi:hypothetical protein
MRWSFIIVSFLLLLLGAAFSTPYQEVFPHPPSDGARLAKIYCSSCHAFPEPGLLPHAIWEKTVLPRMGYQLGIFPNDSVRQAWIETGTGGKAILAAGLFPANPLLSTSDWQKIVQFYLKNAPKALEQPTLPAVNMDLRLFEVQKPMFQLRPPSSTLIRFKSDGGLYLGDANSQQIFWLDAHLNLQKRTKLAEGIVQVQVDTASEIFTLMGSFSPTDAPVGAIVRIPKKGNRAEILLDGLQRPVHSDWVDLNGDGRQDGVVCEFAKWTGKLAWWEQDTLGNFQPHILRNRPGAIKTYVRDFNGDHFPDIIALFGQGDEGIYQYINDGKGNFTEKCVLRFPPSWGSSAFRMVDTNQDGLEDIVYTCGDNADYQPVLKPYHGIRVYTNAGLGIYRETFFYPLHGAYDAIPADFDQDGDLDIAAISFFPDFENRPQEAFLYLENKGAWRMEAFSFPAVTAGRWMLLDAGDLDQDGDLDLALAPLSFEVVPDRGEMKRWVSEGLPFLILKNTLR